ncbi:hypothetical protein [Candidatus Nitronereus thalassa]|uniref:Uncharacterized protein n=1 Tax=Candidatus Nitronereus thalassa TaxID=3020898 RepID=A0ABU3KBD1_9BACT|nr:hypothetical protein [Candidatus Nitronereus thalassa]MDT7043725.1 hypothetical protein [Candidatus Nitronereus thalassa]
MNAGISLPNNDFDAVMLSAQEHQHVDRLTVATIIPDEASYDRFLKTSSQDLLEHATQYVIHRLKETKRWDNTVAYEKLALRLGYELTERFIDYARTKLPMRPVLLLDSFIAQSFSQLDLISPDWPTLSTPLGQYLDALISRAVVSRDGLVTLFWHLYSMTPSHVMKVLAIPEDQQARIFKNYARWRKGGWQQTMIVGGLSEQVLLELEKDVDQDWRTVNNTVCHILDRIQPYYRKSEPSHYLCRDKEAWLDLYANNYDQEYRLWHLAMCQGCFKSLCESQMNGLADELQPLTHFQVRPYGNHVSIDGKHKRSQNFVLDLVK